LAGKVVGDYEMSTINAIISNGQEVTLPVDSLPDTCPICHQGIEPISQFAFWNGTNVVQAIFRCPRLYCNSLFIAYYYEDRSYRNPEDRLRLKRVAPQNLETQEFSGEINKVSPNFVEIFNQAFNAEIYGLNQICGCGYRKALEFLIKDYAISKYPTSKEEIENKNLAKVIIENVDDTNVKTTAELAVWLGNDETHFIRKWTELDIKDLKQLIQLTVKWIESEIITADYKSRMNPK